MSLTISNNTLNDRIYELEFEEGKINFKTKAIVKYLLEEDVKIDCFAQAVFEELLYDNNIKICDMCNHLMKDGYCIEGGFEYRCSDECLCSKEGNLETDITKNEWDSLFDDGEGDSYWTEWECDMNVYKDINRIVCKYPQLGYKADKVFLS